jgi:hypothetical protein
MGATLVRISLFFRKLSWDRGRKSIIRNGTSITE